MAKSRFSEDGILSLLKEYENGKSIIDICKDSGISMPTFCILKRKYSSQSHVENRIKMLEQENFNLKQMYAELSLNCWERKEFIKLIYNHTIKGVDK